MGYFMAIDRAKRRVLKAKQKGQAGPGIGKSIKGRIRTYRPLILNIFHRKPTTERGLFGM